MARGAYNMQAQEGSALRWDTLTDNKYIGAVRLRRSRNDRLGRAWEIAMKSTGYIEEITMEFPLNPLMLQRFSRENKRTTEKK